LENELKREGRRCLNVSRVLRILGVSRSGYNSFKKRESNTKKPSRKDELKALILDVYLKSKQIYGAPKITKELKKRGIKVAEKTVGNYMREMKIKAQRRLVHRSHLYTYRKGICLFDKYHGPILTKNYSLEAIRNIRSKMGGGMRSGGQGIEAYCPTFSASF